MKKVVLALIAVVMFNSLCEAQVSSKLNINIIIGRKSKNCKGLGFCKVRSNSAETGDDDFDGELSGNGTGFELSIDENNFKIIQNHFASSSIILEEDYIIDDPKILEFLGAKSYTLKMGSYNLIYDKVTKTYKAKL